MNIKASFVRASLGILLLFLAGSTRGQDVQINCSQISTCALTPAGGVSWGNGNLTWVFTPINPRVSIYIFIRNYNPTSAHTTQTVSVFQSPFGKTNAPSLTKNSSRWVQDTVTQNGTVGASCTNVNAMNDAAPGASGLGSCYVNTLFAAQVAITISGATTQAGSPDNFDLAIVQETGAPAGSAPGGNGGSLTSTNTGTSAAPPIQTVSDGSSQAFFGTLFTTNPANGAVILNLNNNSGGKTLYLDRLVISASAAASVTFNLTTNAGATCNPSTIVNEKAGSTNPSTATITNLCGTPPSPNASVFTQLPIGANSVVSLDLRGLIVPANTTLGADLVMAASLTGNISATWFWYEK